jgi:hypothetical protein
MRLLFWSLLTLVTLLDAAADLCVGAVAVLYALAWTASLPFVLTGRGLLSLSRRITHGRAP